VGATKTGMKCKPVTIGRKLDIMRIVDSYPNVTPVRIINALNIQMPILDNIIANWKTSMNCLLLILSSQ
jgi:hypothetical protein